MKTSYFKIYCIVLIFAFSCSSEKPTEKKAADASIKTEKTVTKNPNKNLYWGDTHLHTTNSPDAFSFGATLTPDDAFRFAKGETIESEGKDMKLDRPLDFLVVADHAEGFGITTELINENPAFMNDPQLVDWSKRLQKGGKEAARTGRELINAFTSGKTPDIFRNKKVMGKVIYKIWIDYLESTEKHNTPGEFTALAGYEWSALPLGNNLHRIVIFRDDIDKVRQILPTSSSYGNDSEKLWEALQTYEDKTGGKTLAIPHNGNASNGLMFTLTDYEGNPMTKEYAELRSRWEPIVETTQIKGDSESHPFLSPNDEFADYGVAGWDIGNLNLQRVKTNDMYQYEYTREALKNGIKMQDKLGANPFKLGMIGSTDSHTALATADADNYSGKFTSMVNDKERALRSEEIGHEFAKKNKLIRNSWQYLSSGYAAVWAESNTREDIWDAMKRREVYGTTGPRIQLRFFGGWDFNEKDLKAANFAEIGYKKGVPMGADLIKGADKKAPSFMILATKDAVGANLDRVQVIKGWTKNGKTFEKIYNVAWSGDRKMAKDGKLAAVGNTVNVKEATYENSIGKDELATVWVDPDFDPSVSAFYYLRVLEIPTPRWSTYDAARYNLTLAPEVPRTVQQRGYSSPIWYTPSK